LNGTRNTKPFNVFVATSADVDMGAPFGNPVNRYGDKNVVSLMVLSIPVE
jgi:hypothetical protein